MPVIRLGTDCPFTCGPDPWVPGIPNYVPRLKEGVDGSFISCVAQLCSIESAEWNVELLKQLCDEETMELITKIE